MRILVVAKGEERVPYYERAVLQQGHQPHVAKDLNDVPAILARFPFSGVILDMPTIIRAGGAKSEAMGLIERFPVLRLRWNAQERSFTVLSGDDEGDGHEVVAHFLAGPCAAFDPRAVRRERRILATPHVLVSTSSTFPPESTEKTFAKDISPAGAFVFSAREWTQGQHCYLRLADRPEEPPAPAVVARVVPWGGGVGVPGVGLEFQTMTPSLRKHIEALD